MTTVKSDSKNDRHKRTYYNAHLEATLKSKAFTVCHDIIIHITEFMKYDECMTISKIYVDR